MKTKELKRNKGITLIALVITIIVLLILAGISIITLTGENGILNRANYSKKQTEIASVIEQAKTDVLAKQAENKRGTITSENLKEILEKYFNDVPEAKDITSDTVLITKDEYGGKYQISVSEIYSGETEKVPYIPKGLEIGTVVNYNPDGKYNWRAEYYAQDTTSTDKELDSSKDEFNIDTWRVFDINKETGEITLVPEHAIHKGLNYVGAPLGGAQGYNNAVYLLNEACSELYGNEAKGIKARSINMEDIEGKMTKEALAYVHAYSKDNAKYNEQVSSAYQKDKSYYPSIYAKETLSVIDGNKNTNGLGRSQQTELIGKNDNGGYVNATTSIQPFQTYWSTSYEDLNFLQSSFKTADNNVNYYDLLVPESNTFYWIASRGVSTSLAAKDYTYCNFFVYNFEFSDVIGPFLFYSAKHNDIVWNNFFPVVSLSSELLEKNGVDGFAVK